MREYNAPPKTISISYAVFEMTSTGEQKLTKMFENKTESDFFHAGVAEDWISEHGEKDKKYIIQRCVQKWEE